MTGAEHTRGKKDVASSSKKLSTKKNTQTNKPVSSMCDMHTDTHKRTSTHDTLKAACTQPKTHHRHHLGFQPQAQPPSNQQVTLSTRGTAQHAAKENVKSANLPPYWLWPLRATCAHSQFKTALQARAGHEPETGTHDRTSKHHLDLSINPQHPPINNHVSLCKAYGE